MTQSSENPGKLAELRTQVRTLIGDAHSFFHEELWDRDLAALPRVKRLVFALFRITTIVIRGFIEDKCALQASALTYITLMSMVPILAFMLSVSKGLKAQDRLMNVVGLERNAQTMEVMVIEGGPLSNLPEQAAMVAQKTFVYVDNTNFGTLGSLGLLLLFWAVIKSISRVENSFNVIWGVRQSRTFWRKFADYMAVLIIVPFSLLGASALNAMLSSPALLGFLQKWSGPLATLHQRVVGFKGLGLGLVIVVAFMFLYSFMPNTKVKLFPALVGGVTGGMLWFSAQLLYFGTQDAVTKYNAVYGTFAAVPFFLFWLYASWTIVLFGAEVSFAVQNHQTYITEFVAAKASLATKDLLGMVLVFEVGKAFAEGEQFWSVDDFGRQHAVPVRLLSDVLFTLCDAGILLPVAERPGCYVPAKDLAILRMGDIERAFRGDGSELADQLSHTEPLPILNTFREHYDRFSAALTEVTLADLVYPVAARGDARPGAHNSSGEIRHG